MTFDSMGSIDFIVMRAIEEPAKGCLDTQHMEHNEVTKM